MPALYPAFEDPLFTSESFSGRSLSDNLSELDVIAASLNLVTLSEWIDTRTMMLELLDEDQLPANCPPIRWYSAQEGLATVQGLLLSFEQHEDQMPEEREAVIADLQNLMQLLEEAKARNTKFHLLVDL